MDTHSLIAHANYPQLVQLTAKHATILRVLHACKTTVYRLDYVSFLLLFVQLTVKHVTILRVLHACKTTVYRLDYVSFLLLFVQLTV